MKMLKPKQESSNDKMLKTLREIVSSGSNRQCFDCGQRGVTYVNMTIGSFVCTSCSGVLRGLTPPHRVKSISMATFTADELEFVRTHGNDECAKTWLGLWDSKRTLKQDHRDFMIDKYERKRYYLEPASPLKSINTPTPTSSAPQQHSSMSSSAATLNGSAKSNHSSENNLAVLKLTPPAANNRHNHRAHHHNELNGNGIHLHNGSSSSTNGSIKSDNSCSNDFAVDFSKASIYNSNNSLSSTGSGGHANGKITNGFSEPSAPTTGDVNANFADFDNNKIYNAAGLPMTTSSLSNNSLNSSSGTFNSNSSLNSTPSADRYAALKDLDEQLREAKAAATVEQNPPASAAAAAAPVNPFKNPFQNQQQQQHHQQQQFHHQQQQQQRQQSYQNWTIPESQSPFNGFGSPLNTNGFSNGFYYTNNMTQPSPFGGKTVFGNPFMTTGTAATATTTGSSNNPFL